MITYQVESWADYSKDAADIWREQYLAHTEERDTARMRPDEDAYYAMEAHGMLKVLTARDAGKLIGHVWCIIRTHMHHPGVLCGFVDTFYLAKSARRGRVGIRLVKESIEMMRTAGAVRILFMTDVAADSSVLFSRLGFKPINTVHSMWIGD